MKFRKTTVVAALVTGSLALSFGTANADPTAEPAGDIGYSVKLVDKTVVATLKNGTFSITEEEAEPEGKPIAGEAEDDPAESAKTEPAKTKVAEIKDGDDNVVFSMPVDAFNVGDIAVPLESAVNEDDTVLELTPKKTDVEVEKPVDTVNLAAKPIASPEENLKAQNEFASQFGIATAVGGFLGTAVGVVAGGVIGCILGLPFLGVGCIPAAIAGAGIGGVLGTLAVGGPALAVSGMELIETMQAPAGSTKWAEGETE